MINFIMHHKAALFILILLIFVIFLNGWKNGGKGKEVTGNIKQTIEKIEKIKPEAAIPRRSFYMGFVAPKTRDWGYDFTEQSVKDSYDLIESSGDLICYHLAEGVPWPEAFEKKPYNPKVQDAISSQLQHIRKSKAKRFLYMSPVSGEDGMEGYWGEESHMERPGRWKDKDFDDKEAIASYLNFCRDMIRQFRPDFMAYGVEVNFLVKKPALWKKFLVMAEEVYTALKAENPELPIFVSWQIDEHWQAQEKQKHALSQILPYTDCIAVSTYPYFYGYFDPDTIPEGFFLGIAALAPDKPFVVAETGFIAEEFDAFGVKGHGKEDWQNQYVNLLLTQCNKLNARFVAWYVPVDYDLSWDKMKPLKPFIPQVEAFRVWRDAGLLDGEGKSRKSFETWIKWLKSPKMKR